MLALAQPDELEHGVQPRLGDAAQAIGHSTQVVAS
jgi:hypothetical protein